MRWRRNPAATAYRKAFELHAQRSLTAASLVAREWAEWAAGEELVDEAADAYWALVRQVPAEVSRLLGPDGRTDLLKSLQGTAAESGYWLVRAGRSADAVVALELARAVVHSQRTRRIPTDLADRLHRAGRDELYRAYTDAVDKLNAVEQDQYGSPQETDETGVFVGGTWYATGSIAPAQQAWSDYQRVRATVLAALAE